MKKNAEKFLKDNKVTAAVKNAEAKTLEELRAFIVSDGIFTEDEVKEMTEEQLYKALAAGRIETAQLLTAEMRQAYYRAKEYRVSFAEKQATMDIINGMDETYRLALATYSTTLTAYSKAITDLDELRYRLLVSPDSDYQQALAKLRDAKEELLKEKKLMLTVKVNDEKYAEISVSFKLSEENYNKMLKAVEDAGSAANRLMESAVTFLRQQETTLRELEAKFPEEIAGKLTAEAKNIENKINEVKDGFFAEFEKAHKSDIEQMEKDLEAKKQELINDAKG